MQKQILPLPTRNKWLQSRGFSSAVATTGGKTIWLAGHVGTSNDAEESLANDFEAQVRQTFKSIEHSLKALGGELSDLVTMTVYLRNQSDGNRFVELRREILQKNFPASTLLTVAGFARPEILVEITPVAVVNVE